MKKIFLLAPLALASCGLLGVPKGDVSGTITGTPEKTGDIKIAITGLTTDGAVSETPDQLTVGTFNTAKKVYTISLPENPAAGLYGVYAFTDVNKDGKFNVLTESRTKVDGQWLKYSAADGWQLVKGLTVVKTGKPFTDYNLSW